MSTTVSPDVVLPVDQELPPPVKPSVWKRIAANRWLAYYTTPLILLAAIGLWELYVRTSDISPFVLPSPLAVGEAFGEQITDGYVWREHIWTTLKEILLGLSLAIVVGVSLGFLMGKYQLFDRVLRPFIVGTQVIPKVALIPLFILWFGFGSTSKVVTAALLAFFPLLVNTAFGVRSVQRGMHDLMTTLGGTRRERFLKVELPHTMAYILAGMELAVVQATIGAIVAEYLGGDRGLGRYAVNLQSQLQVDKLFGAILMMAIFGFVLYTIVTSLRRILIPWHESSQQRN